MRRAGARDATTASTYVAARRRAARGRAPCACAAGCGAARRWRGCAASRGLRRRGSAAAHSAIASRCGRRRAGSPGSDRHGHARPRARRRRHALRPPRPSSSDLEDLHRVGRVALARAQRTRAGTAPAIRRAGTTSPPAREPRPGAMSPAQPQLAAVDVRCAVFAVPAPAPRARRADRRRARRGGPPTPRRGCSSAEEVRPPEALRLAVRGSRSRRRRARARCDRRRASGSSRGPASSRSCAASGEGS